MNPRKETTNQSVRMNTDYVELPSEPQERDNQSVSTHEYRLCELLSEPQERDNQSVNMREYQVFENFSLCAVLKPAPFSNQCILPITKTMLHIRVFHKLSAIRECQHCQLRFSSAIKKSTIPIKHVTLKYNPHVSFYFLFHIY